ncbi:uncharacterized protein LOC105169472 [Sesamum indicum]|uniref:Uncharacterized protein LOC105169472 n=1 Tax=Sesamum indicum TaxID=4182 RepID=A0A6I9TWL0_SESIN|nr:uncharacterized protein LOC105169472 [Sesamum indicum]
MDLGCIDMGCVEKSRKETSLEKDSSPKESATSASKIGKNNKSKDAVRSSLNALNKLTSQISKPPRRKTSPLNWFPRKKVEPYLKRKIKMLQEVDGMRLTLDETLGDSNPHYSRVLREKIAIREAAEKAMEARKGAMVEASWCRILQAARIESKEAEAQLSRAELSAAEAAEAARAVGVIMNDDMLGCVQNHYKIETTSSSKGGSTTHTVLATFETAFEVDKQVAAAVKAAFIKLANCPSINKEEFKELLRKISENPDTEENCNELTDFTLDCESDAGPELEVGSCCNKEFDGTRLRKHKKGQESDKFSMTNIVDMMLGRLRGLKEEELASLATIVATSGLNAALSSAVESTKDYCSKVPSRVSVGGRMARNSFADAQVGGTGGAELPGLDKFLVKRLTRLEREVLEAKNARKNEASDASKQKLDATDDEKLFSVKNTSSRTEVKLKEDMVIPDLGSVLVKHSSKLEKEVEEARMNAKSSEVDNRKFQRGRREQKDVAEVPSLDKYLVKRLTRLEREVQEARNRKNFERTEGERVIDSRKTTAILADATNLKEIPFSSTGDSVGKENMDLNKIENRNSTTLEVIDSKDQNHKSEVLANKILLQTDDSLRSEKKEAAPSRSSVGLQQQQSEDRRDNAAGNYESLDKVLVKHVSRLEKEKMEFRADEQMQIQLKRKDTYRETESTEGSLDHVLVKHKSRLEKEKLAAAEKQDDSTRHSISRQQARDREFQEAWGGLSLGNSIRPHVSRLQRDKAAWLEAEEQERKRATTGEV